MSKNSLTLILIFSLGFMLLSCKDKVSAEIYPPWDHFSEGELDFRHSTENAESKEIKDSYYSFLKTSGYEFPDEKQFQEQVQNYFQLDVNEYSVNQLALNYSLNPYLAYNNERFVAQESMDNQEVLLLNQLLFYNDKQAELELKSKHPEIFLDMVYEFGFTQNRDWIDWAIQKKTLNGYSGETPNLFSLLFGDYNIKGGEQLELRKEMLNGLIEQKADLSKLSEVAAIVLNSNRPFTQDNQELAGWLLAQSTELAEPQFGVIEQLYDSNPEWIAILKANDYYGSNPLKQYTEEIYQAKDKRYGLGNLDPDYEVFGIIEDADGYTNLRKEKNSSSEIIKQIPSGTRVAIAYQEGDWWTVVLPDGNRGFVHKSRIKLD